MKKKKTLSLLFWVGIAFTLAIFSFSTVLAGAWDVTTLNNKYTLPSGSVGAIINMLATWLVGMFAFFGVSGFLISGIMYLISTGNDEMITKAKKYMLYSIVGVIVGISGYVIIQAADLILNAKSVF